MRKMPEKEIIIHHEDTKAQRTMVVNNSILITPTALGDVIIPLLSYPRKATAYMRE